MTLLNVMIFSVVFIGFIATKGLRLVRTVFQLNYPYRDLMLRIARVIMLLLMITATVTILIVL